jgi:hypothetical protein
MKIPRFDTFDILANIAASIAIAILIAILTGITILIWPLIM